MIAYKFAMQEINNNKFEFPVKLNNEKKLLNIHYIT